MRPGIVILELDLWACCVRGGMRPASVLRQVEQIIMRFCIEGFEVLHEQQEDRMTYRLIIMRRSAA